MEEEIPESEVETVVAGNTGQPGANQQDSQVFEEVDYAVYCEQFEAWRSGVLTDQEVLSTFGRDVLSMMQAQRVAVGTQMDEDESEKVQEDKPETWERVEIPVETGEFYTNVSEG